MPLIKPGRWTVNPADIDPRFLNLWSDLKWIVPLWQGDNPGKGVHVITPNGGLQIASTATWTTGSGKYGHWVDGVNCSGDSDLVLGPLPVPLRFSGFDDFTIMFVFKFNDASNFTPYLGQDSASSSGRVEVYLNGSDQLICQVVAGGTSGLGTPTITFIDGEDYVVTVSREDGGTEFAGYVNGVLDNRNPGNGAQSANTSLPLGVFGSPGTSWVGAETGRGYLVAAWDRAFSEEEHLAIHRDPFGFIRPKVEPSGIFSSLYANADGTIESVVNEVDSVLGFPQVRATTYSTEAADTTSHDVDMTGVQEGDRAILFACMDNDAGDTDISGMPAGWSLMHKDGQSAGGGQDLEIWEKINCTGSESSFQYTTNTSERSKNRVFFITGSSENALEASAASNAANVNPDPDTVTASWGSALNLFIAFYISDNQRGDATAYPTSYTDNQYTNTVVTGTDQDVAYGVATRELEAASDNPATFTKNFANRWRAVTLVVQPGSSLWPSINDDPEFSDDTDWINNARSV